MRFLAIEMRKRTASIKSKTDIRPGERHRVPVRTRLFNGNRRGNKWTKSDGLVIRHIFKIWRITNPSDLVQENLLLFLFLLFFFLFGLPLCPFLLTFGFALGAFFLSLCFLLDAFRFKVVFYVFKGIL
jgi:hypothetical protein